MPYAELRMDAAAASPVSVKGSMIVGRMAFVERHYPDRWQEYLSALSAPTRAAVAAGILKSSWYPFSMFLDASGTAERLFGTGDYSIVRKMAAHSARVNMPTVYKVFLRLGSPQFMMKQVAQIWRSQYDSGIATSTPGKESGAVEVREFGQPDPLHCNGITGFMEECLRIVGMKSATVVHPKCRCNGDDLCRWEATWRE
jgi:hypothetical protein